VVSSEVRAFRRFGHWLKLLCETGKSSCILNRRFNIPPNTYRDSSQTIIVCSIDAPRNPGETLSNNIDDRLVSLCLGVNASLNFHVPFGSGSSYPFFYSSLKFRYLHSLWFDVRGRDVSNYYQSFVFSQLNLGIGYNF
jgi:hypothetical protein